MRIFFCSDTHFNHTRIILGWGTWGFREFKNIEEMNETMIDNWNSIVSKDDIIIHLGDFGLCNKTQIRNLVKKLNGKIIILKGNHDRKTKLNGCGFLTILKGVVKMKVKYNNKVYEFAIRHKPNDVEGVEFVICGHSHDDFKIREGKKNTFVNIGVDQNNYYPASLLDVLNEIDKICMEGVTSSL